MNKIKTYRHKAKLTQEQLAKQVGLSQMVICLYEQNRREPSLATIKKLAIALHCKPTDLYPDLAG